MDPTRGDSRYNINYSMSGIGLSLADQTDIYGVNPAASSALGARPPSGGLIQTMGVGSGVGFSSRSGNLMPNTSQCQSNIAATVNSPGSSHQQRGIKRAGSDCYDEHHRGGSASMTSQSLQGLDSCITAQQSAQPSQVSGNVPDIVDDSYTALQSKKSPPANGKKTKGRVKIKMEYIDNKLRRYTTFSKRKTGIMKKAYELSTLTGTQVMLLVASETGHVYTFATRKLQPMITSEAGKQLIQTCLNSPDPPSVGGGDQRMSATGFEETELSYNIADEDSKEDRSPISSGNESDESSDAESIGPALRIAKNISASTEECEKVDFRVKAKSEVGVITLDEQHNRPISLNSNLMSYLTHQEKELISPITENEIHTAATTSLSSIPQEVLLKLIKSGHLQLHTEEDGSGHQYVSIPLSSSTSNLVKSNKFSEATDQKNVTLKDINLDGISNWQNKTGSEIIIKQEFE